jgi:hypothetical protein
MKVEFGRVLKKQIATDDEAESMRHLERRSALEWLAWNRRRTSFITRIAFPSRFRRISMMVSVGSDSKPKSL